jgi:hypothetical protein
MALTHIEVGTGRFGIPGTAPTKVTGVIAIDLLVSILPGRAFAVKWIAFVRAENPIGPRRPASRFRMAIVTPPHAHGHGPDRTENGIAMGQYAPASGSSARYCSSVTTFSAS